MFVQKDKAIVGDYLNVSSGDETRNWTNSIFSPNTEAFSRN